jgi:hypothetical protein
MDLLFDQTKTQGREIVTSWNKYVRVTNEDLIRLMDQPDEIGYLLGSQGPVLSSTVFKPIVEETIPAFDRSFVHKYFGQFKDAFWAAVQRPGLSQTEVLKLANDSGFDFLFALFLSQSAFFDQNKYKLLAESQLWRTFLARNKLDTIINRGGGILSTLRALESGAQLATPLEDSLEESLVSLLDNGTATGVPEAASFLCRSLKKYSGALYRQICLGKETAPKEARTWEFRTSTMAGAIPEDIPGYVQFLMKKQDEVPPMAGASYRSPVPQGGDLRISAFFNPRNPEKGLVFRTKLQLGVIIWSALGGWRVVVLTPNEKKSDFRTEVGFLAQQGSDSEVDSLDTEGGAEYHFVLRSATPLFVVATQGQEVMETTDDNPGTAVASGAIDWGAAVKQVRGIVSGSIVATAGFSTFFQKKANFKVRLVGALLLLVSASPQAGRALTAVTDTSAEVILEITKNLNTTKVVEQVRAIPAAIEETLTSTKRSVAGIGFVAAGALLVTSGGKKKRSYSDIAAPGLLALGSTALLIT